MARPTTTTDDTGSLSLGYAVLCVVDMVGLFPVIALPRAIINCGWLGIPLAFSVLAIEVYTALLLGRCWIMGEKIDSDLSRKKRCPYGALVELAYGRGLSNYVTVILDLSIFGACVPDLLIASQNLQVIGLKISRNETDISYCTWLLVLGCLITPIMLLGSPKDMKLIGVASVSVVLVTSLLTWLSILDAAGWNGERWPEVRVPRPSWESTAIAYGTLAFQFDVHPMILSVQMDMKNKNDVGKAIVIAFLVSGGLLGVTMGLCYSLLGDRVQYNTLQALPQSVLLDTALCLATLQVCLSMAVGSTPFFQDVEHRLRLPSGFGWRRVVVRGSLILLAVAIGEAIPRFDLLMGLLGGALTSQLIFLFPALIYRRLSSILREQHYQSVEVSRVSEPNQVYLLTPEWLRGSYWSRSRRYGTFSVEKTANLLSRTAAADLTSSWPELESVLPGWLGGGGRFERFLLLIIPTAGIGATAVATFFSFRETWEYAEYEPSCLINHIFPARYLTH